MKYNKINQKENDKHDILHAQRDFLSPLFSFFSSHSYILSTTSHHTFRFTKELRIKKLGEEYEKITKKL